MSLPPLIVVDSSSDSSDSDEEWKNQEWREISPIQSDLRKSEAINEVLLNLLETGRFSDVQFLVGDNEYSFDCHKAIVGVRSEVLAAAMEQRWIETNVVSNKAVVRLPVADADAFKVFLHYLYSNELNLEPGDDEIDLLLNVMSLSHMYQVDELLNKCVERITPKINATTCWTIYKETRLIVPSLSEDSFRFLCDNIHEAAAGNEFCKWDGETIRRILSLERSFVSEINLLAALRQWVKFPTDPSEEQRQDMYEKTLLPLIRFPSMNSVTFSKVARMDIFSKCEASRLRRFIANTKPKRKNTTIYSHVPRFVDTHAFRLKPYSPNVRTTKCVDDCWDTSEKNFKYLINSDRGEFSIETNCPTTITSLLLHNVIKRDIYYQQCQFNLKITFYIYVGEKVHHKEQKTLKSGTPLFAGPVIQLDLPQPFEMKPGRVYEFQVLYELLEDDEGMASKYKSYEYTVTWSIAPPISLIASKLAHGILFKTNCNVKDDDEVDHGKIPRWICSVDFVSQVSQNCEQFCTLS